MGYVVIAEEETSEDDHSFSDETWRVELDGELLEEGLDEEGLSGLFYEAIDDGDLDVRSRVVVVQDGNRVRRRAIDFCDDDQKRMLGYVIARQPVGGETDDDADEAYD